MQWQTIPVGGCIVQSSGDVRPALDHRQQSILAHVSREEHFRSSSLAQLSPIQRLQVDSNVSSHPWAFGAKSVPGSMSFPASMSLPTQVIQQRAPKLEVRAPQVMPSRRMVSPSRTYVSTAGDPMISTTSSLTSHVPSSTPDDFGDFGPQAYRRSAPNAHPGAYKPQHSSAVPEHGAHAVAMTVASSRSEPQQNSALAPRAARVLSTRPVADSGGAREAQHEKKVQLVVALDVDEVLCQYVEGFRKFLRRVNPQGPQDIDYVFNEAHDPTSPWRLQFATSGGLDNLEAVPGAVEALLTLKKAGIRLEAVTSRPPIMRQSTEALLRNLFPPNTFAAAHFVGPGQKGITCNAIGAQALVDDQAPNCIDACACGVISVLFDFQGSYVWSHDFTELPSCCTRIETWEQTCTFLLSTLGVYTLEHMGLSSEFLLSVKKVVSRSTPRGIEYYQDALNEAEKVLTDYGSDFDSVLECDVPQVNSAPARAQNLPFETKRDKPLYDYLSGETMRERQHVSRDVPRHSDAIADPGWGDVEVLGFGSSREVPRLPDAIAEPGFREVEVLGLGSYHYQHYHQYSNRAASNEEILGPKGEPNAYGRRQQNKEAMPANLERSPANQTGEPQNPADTTNCAIL